MVTAADLVFDVDVTARIIGGPLNDQLRLITLCSDAADNVVIGRDGPGDKSYYYLIDSANNDGPRYTMLYLGPCRG